VSAFIAYTIIGITTGAGFALISSGFVLTYTTSRIFNLAHGAMAMGGAYLYYALAFQHHVNRLLALIIVVGIVAPLFGVVVDRLLMRGLAEAPVNVSLVTTIALFALLYGIVSKEFPPDKIGPVTPLLQSVHVGIAGQTIDGNAMLKVIIAVAAAVGFYFFFKLTRTGVAMRAVVDNRSLLALHGANPGFMSALSWAIGSALAAIAGVLLSASSDIGLYPYVNLTLLVITAYAAAILGKLENLPMTFVGSLILGLATSYAIGYLPANAAYNGFRVGTPAIFLFLVLVALPRAPLRVGQIRGIPSVPIASWRRTISSGVVLIVVAWVLTHVVSSTWNFNFALAFCYASIMLSLVLLTGYGGYLNLAPITFAGLGALVVSKFHTGQPYTLFLAALIVAAIGAVIGLFAIRLGTLYLAIATLAFAQLMEYFVFQSNSAFKGGENVAIHRLDLFGYHFQSEGSYFVLSVVVFVLLAMLVLSLRRGSYGRLLIALRDSPAACGTLGLNLTFTRVGVFAISAAIAGFAGGLYAQQEASIGPTDFLTIQNLPLLLLTVIGGMTSVTGVALGGLGLAVLTKVGSLAQYEFIIIAIVAMLMARNPNGLAAYIFRFGRWALQLGQPGRAPTAGATTSETTERLPGTREEVVVGGSA
jgi:branched-chain amino acid transport system permease protein